MSKLDHTKQISGYWLSFSDEEKTEIAQALHDLGYDGDLKQFVLDALLGDDDAVIEGIDHHKRNRGATDRVLDGVEGFLRDHPEVVAKYRGMASTVATNLLNKLMQKTPDAG